MVVDPRERAMYALCLLWFRRCAVTILFYPPLQRLLAFTPNYTPFRV